MTNQNTELASVPDDDLSWCHETVQDVSRTFALTIDVLNEPMASHICIGYLLCRIADTVEDSNSLSAAEKTDLLEQYDRVIDPNQDVSGATFEDALQPHLPEDRTDDWALVANSNRVIRTFEQLQADVREAIIPPTRELIHGMTIFVDRYSNHDGIRIRSEEELQEYCHYVAGTVGGLITNLIVRISDEDHVKEELRRTAEGFGQLLQLVNIAKDVRGDYTHENNVYLPADWLGEVNVSQEDILAPANKQKVAAVIERTADHARSYLEDAQSYLDTLSEIDQNVFAAWTIPFLLAVGTLRELSDRPGDALSPGGVKINRNEVAAVVAAVTTDIESTSLASLRKSVWQGDLG